MMPNRIGTVDVGLLMVKGELEARHLNPKCYYSLYGEYYFTLYGNIPGLDVLAALNGDSELFQLWMLGFTLSLSEN